jgi:hypothetical protein
MPIANALDGKESTDSIWLSPREALAGGESGRFKLPFPTTRNLIKLGKQPSVKGRAAIYTSPFHAAESVSRPRSIQITAHHINAARGTGQHRDSIANMAES